MYAILTSVYENDFVNAHEWAYLKIGINVWMRLKTFKEFFVILSCMISLIYKI